MSTVTFNATIDELPAPVEASEPVLPAYLQSAESESAAKKAPRKAPKRDAQQVSPEKKRITLPPPMPLTGAPPFAAPQAPPPLAASTPPRAMDDADALLLTVVTGATVGAALALSAAYLFFQLSS